MLNSCQSLLKKGVAEKIFSAAAAGIYHKTSKGDKRIVCTYGTTKNEETGKKVDTTTLFDLASLTKPLCTVLCVLCLVEQKKIKWSTRVGEIIQGRLTDNIANITLEQLLSHSAGLAAYKPFYKDFSPEIQKDTKGELLKRIVVEKQEYLPGSKCVYSDLGYMLLGGIIEKVSGTTLDTFYRDEIILPLGMEQDLMFRPLDIPEEGKKRQIAPTEDCPWRHRVIEGEVHDEHCWLMGGVSGHAGLFGSLDGVLGLVEKILHVRQERDAFCCFDNKLLHRALAKQYRGQTWCLGFDTPSKTGSSGGRYLSTESVGHLGFTGTSFWIDPEKELAVVLLTNRVHPSRTDERIKEFRPLFHDAVIGSE